MRRNSSNALVPILESVVFVIAPFATDIHCEASSNATVSGSLSCVAPLKWCVSSAFRRAPRAGGHVGREIVEPDVRCDTTWSQNWRESYRQQEFWSIKWGFRNVGSTVNIIFKQCLLLGHRKALMATGSGTECGSAGRGRQSGQSPSDDAQGTRPQSWYTRRSEFKAGTRTSLPCGSRPWMKPTCVKKETLAASRLVQSFFLLSWSVAIVHARSVVTKKRSSSKRNNTVCRVPETLGQGAT